MEDKNYKIDLIRDSSLKMLLNKLIFGEVALR